MSEKLSHKSSNTLSTSCSINDPNDEIWFEFLSSLAQERPDPSSADKCPEQSSNSDEKSTEDEQTGDNDDAADDPDFTVCLENCDLEDPYFPDACFQVPKKEAVELVKDAIEICDGAPIVYEDKRHSKIKSSITIKKLTTENRTKILMNRASKLGASIEPKITCAAKKDLNISSKSEFVPEFSEFQRKQLDEQLRNHVQLLTQSCLITFISKEYRHVFDEAQNLLIILKDLNQKIELVKENKEEENKEDENSDMSMVKSSNFGIYNLDEALKIISDTDEDNSDKNMVKLSNFGICNLDEALKIISDIQQMSTEELNMDLKQGIPSKFLEIIITSPVFYNTSLIPNLSRFKYYSQFKRAQFTDTEKILLIMGFNKFKHLPKSECCECIKEHLLPIRSCDDIRKQLNNFSSSELRQKQLKELLKRQRQIKTNWMLNYNFIKEIHYRSPFEQADHVQLPPQYTMILERVKLAKVLKDSKKSQKERAADNDKENERRQSILSQHIKSIEAIQIEETSPTRSCDSPVIELIPNKFTKIRPKITKIANKRARDTSFGSKNDNDMDIIILDNETGNKNSSPAKKHSNGVFELPTFITSQNAAVNSNLPGSLILPSSDLANMFSRPVSIINPTFVRPTNPNYPMVQQLQTIPQNMPVILPANFSGTVLIQPTIHIHTNSKNAKTDKFCKIKPKNPENSPAKAKKK